MLWSVVILSLFGQVALSKPLVERWDDFSIKHGWSDTPKGWELHGPAPADHQLDLNIALKQDKFDELISNLFEVSDPAHQRYGEHLSKEEVAALIAPHPNTVELVDAWFAAHGVDVESVGRSEAGDMLKCTVSVEQANRMLGTNYSVWRNTETSEYIVRTMEYSLPSSLHGHIDVVSPTTYFGGLKRMKSTLHKNPGAKIVDPDAEDFVGPDGLATVPSSCKSTITPSCLRALYGTSSYTPAATDTNAIGITAYLEEYASTSDFKAFLKKYRTDASSSFTFDVELVNGGKNTQSDPGDEANLDVQYSVGISYPTPMTFYSTGGSPPFTPDSQTPTNTNEPYQDWLNYVLALDTVPQTFSTSYGDDEQTVPLDYATSVCNQLAQLGARGSSIMFSSGDDGVGGGSCEKNDGSKKDVFQPNFPASCPYVTTVGGTESVSPEVAASFSGGGFSSYFAQPSYQATAVNKFVKALGTKYSGLYNASGRAYPDVAAQSVNFEIILDGETEAVDGTSCASPTFAGVIALLNDYRISLGKSPLGFLNPFIYSNGSTGFTDITSGDNPGCGTNGFSAATGWDPVTGLGTPDFTKLQPLVAAL